MLQSFRYDEAVADELAGVSGKSASAGLEQMMRRLASQRALPESHQSRYYQTHPDAVHPQFIRITLNKPAIAPPQLQKINNASWNGL